jgi:TolB-like protein/DNA-binding SARP family transcriptional activator/Flp pilus assembly protein TadD
MPRATLRLLGAPSLTDASGARIESLLAQPKRFAVLAYLAIEARENPVTRDKVATLFWPELDQQRARQALRQSLHVIRGELGEESISGVGAEMLALNLEIVGSDVAEFTSGLKSGDEVRALESYGGHLLDGFNVGDSPEFEQWASEARQRLRSQAVAAAKTLAARAEAAGDVDSAVRRLQQQLAISDIDEQPLRRLMTLLKQQGNPSAAIASYDDYARRMHRELEVEPSAETSALAQELRAEVGASGPPPSRAPSSYTPGGQLTSAGDPRIFKPLLAIVATTVIVAAVAGFWYRSSLGAPPDGPPSVAVLPFLDLSAAKDQQFLPDGLTEELITALSKVRGLKVTARTSTFRYRDAREDVPRIGRELGVTSVLEGSVRREGERIRVTAQLIDARTGFHLWADNFDRKVGELIALEDEIADAISRSLRVQLVGPAPASRPERGTVPAAAHEAYLKGRFFWNQRDVDGTHAAIALFKQAISLDSTYAAAWAGLASAYQLAPNFNALSPNVAFPLALDAVQRAIALDPEAADAYASLGFISYQWKRDWPGAEAALRKSLELAPGYASAWQWLGLYHVGMHQLDSALVAARRARELDPVSISINCAIGDVFLFRQDFDSAGAAYSAAAALDPEFDRALVGQAEIASLRGDHANAIRLAERAVAKRPNPRYVGFLGYIYGHAGRAADARRALDSVRAVSRRTYVPPSAFVMAHLGVAGPGQRDSVISWASRSVPQHDAWAIQFFGFPELKSYLSEPRLAKLFQPGPR